MITTRRGFLGSILALAAAPAIVRADSLMRCIPTDTTIIEPVIGSIDRFTMFQGQLPEIWSKKLDEKFYQATLFGDVTQREYDALYGDSMVDLIAAAQEKLDSQDVPGPPRFIFADPKFESVLRGKR